MCIIAYIGRGKKISDNTIKVMFKGNKDGAGIMYQRSPKDDVRIIKGFMNVDDLIKAFREIPEQYERAIHCRIATAGKVSVQCCHPFPVRSMADNMMQAKDEAPVAYMHNGIISWCNPRDGMKSPYSDTMLFGKRVLYPVRHQLDNEGVQNLIEHAINGSRLLVFRKGGAPIMFGNWEEDTNGVKYSNGHYKEYTYYYGGCWSGYNSKSTTTTTTTTKNTTTTTTTTQKKETQPKKEAVKSPQYKPYQNDYTGGYCNFDYDCVNCPNTDCKWNESDIDDRTCTSYISIKVPKENYEEAFEDVEDTIMFSGFDIVDIEECLYDTDNVELFIEVIGYTPVDASLRSVAGYEVLNVWAD